MLLNHDLNKNVNFYSTLNGKLNKTLIPSMRTRMLIHTCRYKDKKL